MTTRIRSYRELSRFTTLQERYDYLKLSGSVGAVTFGFDRYLNQNFYRSREWKQVRTKVIIRDEGCDLGVAGYPCVYKPVIHHINPITLEQVEKGDPIILDLDNLILCTDSTHRAIHYGTLSQERLLPIERKPFDTCPWKEFKMEGGLHEERH